MDESLLSKKKEKSGISRKVGVHNTSLAAEARDKIVKKLNSSKNEKCSKCCCLSHCGITGHRKNDVTVSGSKLWVLSSSSLSSTLLDASWDSLEDYCEQLDEFVMQKEVNSMKLSSLLVATNIEFGGESLC